MTRLARVRGNHTLVLLDDQGNPHVELRPYYHEGTGPAVEFYRINLAGTGEYLCTFRLPTVAALVRKLPIVTAAARRLEARAKKPAK